MLMHTGNWRIYVHPNSTMKKKKLTGKKSAAAGKCPDAVDDDDFNDKAEAEKASKKDVVVEKSRIRCVHQNVNYVKYVKYLCQNS